MTGCGTDRQTDRWEKGGRSERGWFSEGASRERRDVAVGRELELDPLATDIERLGDSRWGFSFNGHQPHRAFRSGWDLGQERNLNFPLWSGESERFLILLKKKTNNSNLPCRLHFCTPLSQSSSPVDGQTSLPQVISRIHGSNLPANHANSECTGASRCKVAQVLFRRGGELNIVGISPASDRIIPLIIAEVQLPTWPQIAPHGLSVHLVRRPLSHGIPPTNLSNRLPSPIIYTLAATHLLLATKRQTPILVIRETKAVRRLETKLVIRVRQADKALRARLAKVTRGKRNVVLAKGLWYVRYAAKGGTSRGWRE